MGTGTDIAIESADVTLVKGDLRGIVKGGSTQPQAPCGTFVKICFSPSFTMCSAYPWQRACWFPSLEKPHLLQPDDCGRRDEFQFGFSYYERAAPATIVALEIVFFEKLGIIGPD